MSVPDGYESTFAPDDPDTRTTSGDGELVVPSPNDPMAVARQFIAETTSSVVICFYGITATRSTVM